MPFTALAGTDLCHSRLHPTDQNKSYDQAQQLARWRNTGGMAMAKDLDDSFNTEEE